MLKAILFIHIAAGTFGLAIGPLAMLATKRRGLHSQIGEIYHWLMFIVCLSAAIMAIVHWERSWYFLGIGTFSYGFAFRGYIAARRRKPGWLFHHIGGMIGSYIAMVTALLVVNAKNLPVLNKMPTILVWLLPTIIGSPLIRVVQNKLKSQIGR